jgi:hypothetical protein
MTDDRELSLILDRWLDDGPVEMPDRVIDVTALRISRQRQRPAWRLDWRHLSMTTTFKLAAAIAAIAIVAVVGYSLLPGRSAGVGGPPPSPTPTVGPAARLSEGLLSPGTYSLKPYGGDAAGVTVTLNVPAGWSGLPPMAVVGSTDRDAPGGSAIFFTQTGGAFDDPCHWDKAGTGLLEQPGQKEVGPTVDALVADLRANKAYTSTAPTDITVDGHPGRRLMLELPSNVDISSCDKERGDTSGSYYILQPPNGIYAQGPGNRWDMRIFDVDGSRLIVAVLDYPTTPADVQAQTQAVIDSITISK